MLYAVTLATLFFLSGYIWTYADFRESQGDFSTRWYDVFGLPGIAGDFITNQRVLGGADWSLGEACEYPNQIALWTAAVWTPLCLLIGWGISVVSKYLRKRPSFSPQKSPLL